MAGIKITVALLLIYFLNGYHEYWYHFISWIVYWVTISCVAWYFSRRITRDFLCDKIIPRVDPHGKAVLITGCASGFGYEAALDLNRKGFFVFAGCRNAKGPGTQDLKRLASFPLRMEVLQLDITKPDEIEKAYQKVQETIATSNLGVRELYGLINNAGRTYMAPIEWAKPDSIEEYETIINTNTYGTIRMTRKFLPLLRKSKGRIINITSVASRTNAMGITAYGISKVAISRFTEGLQEELAHFGVTAVDINPWFYKTKITDVKTADETSIKGYKESTDEVQQAYSSLLPKIRKMLYFVLEDPRIVCKQIDHVTDAISDALTSAEPDAVYRVMPPVEKTLFWFFNDWLPWDIILLLRKQTLGIVDSFLADPPKYTTDENENYKRN